MTVKNKYVITINTPSENINLFSYKYGNFKEPVQLEVGDNYIKISFYRPKLYEHDNLFDADNYLSTDAVRKSVLLHTIHFSKPFLMKKLNISVNGISKEVTSIFYSMIDDILRNIPLEFRNVDIINHILNTAKTKQSNLSAALYAYIYSKTKKYETERFMYLWMAINGLYGAICKEIKHTRPEREQIKRMAFLIDESLGYIKCDDRPKFMNPILKQIHNDGFLSEAVKDLSKYIQPDGKDIYEKSMLTLWLPYYVRCNLFHASKPVTLISFKNEYEVTYLKILNNNLENYLDENLYKFFNTEYMQKNIDFLNNNNEKFEDSKKH